jgi:signal transduction histidine kinase
MTFSFSPGYCQASGDLQQLLKVAKQDTNRVNLLLKLSWQYYFSKPDTCLLINKEALELADKLNYLPGKLLALNNSGESLRFMGEYPKALEMQLKALELYRSTNNKAGEAATLGFIGFIYMELNEFRQGLHYLFHAKNIFDVELLKENNAQGPRYKPLILSNIGNSYEKLNILDSALLFQQLAWIESKSAPVRNVQALILTRLGNVFSRRGNYNQALKHYHHAQQVALKIKDNVNLSKVQFKLSDLFFSKNIFDSAFYYARQSYKNGLKASQKLSVLDASKMLTQLFRRTGNKDSLIYYQDIAIAVNDSLFGQSKHRQLQVLTLNEQKREQEIVQQQERYKNTITKIVLSGLLLFLLTIAIILLRNVRQKQRVNTILNDQKNEIQKNLVELKSTQDRLIQSEKMASLGELTAGIAHEIQNPLNFVNNFADVNKELLAELKQEIVAGNPQEAISIAADIEENEQKIIHHGKRADAIVKNMLQHSRASSGSKVETNINALADEYLRLSYHGLRVKDNDFNANFTTNFDESIGKIEVVPQDIGRVLLNLYNNAFYSVNEKKKNLDGMYEPTVSVSTKRTDNNLEISVNDNGTGIPPNILEKIFQPFFTTKQTGEGTGLGLSMSYDIVKAHGGELKVETQEGQGAEFIIQLPNE